jgi:hypothetical protein
MCLNETYSKVSYPQCLDQGDALYPLFFNFALEYVIGKVQENQVRRKLNRTHQLLVYADDVNLLGDITDTIKKNIETLTLVRGWSRSAEKTKYLLRSRHQNAGQNRDMKVANRFLENVGQFIWERQ